MCAFKRPFLKDPIDLHDYLSEGSWVWPLWSNLGTQLDQVVVCPFQLGEFPWPQRIWPWQGQKRVCPSDTGVTAALDVTRPLERDWTIHTKTSSSGKCITGYLVSVYLQDKDVWHHKTSTNARLSSLVQLTHIKSSAWPANTPRINP